jgi:GDP-4-dehydro-6-deoxy-D-mannose reductase
MGSHLCEALAGAGHVVLATYYKPTVDSADLAGLALEEVYIRDWCSVYDSLTRFRPNAVFHLAAQSHPTVSWQRPIETLETNIIGTANVLETVRRLDTDVRVVVAGSSAEYGTVDPKKVPVSEGGAAASVAPLRRLKGCCGPAWIPILGRFRAGYATHPHFQLHWPA